MDTRRDVSVIFSTLSAFATPQKETEATITASAAQRPMLDEMIDMFRFPKARPGNKLTRSPMMTCV
jgi:hypothetical protein